MGDFLWVFVGVIVFSVLLYLLASFVFGPGEPTPPAGEQVPDPLPEDGPLTAEDIAAVRLRVVPRGYHMGDVDVLLERVARELTAQQTIEPAEPVEPEPGQVAGPEQQPVEPEQQLAESADQPTESENVDQRG